MRALLIGLTAAATIGLAAPASAQVYFGVGPGGFGIGVGAPGYYGYAEPYYYAGAYGYGCRTVREPVQWPGGWVDYRDRRVWD